MIYHTVSTVYMVMGEQQLSFQYIHVNIFLTNQKSVLVSSFINYSFFIYIFSIPTGSGWGGWYELSETTHKNEFVFNFKTINKKIKTKKTEN